ncbi:MAG: ribonuclease HIII [Bacilli bacterium]|nr:ribonuclease HIII [Bacilli bacterium]
MTISFKISDNTKQEMIKYFRNNKRPKTPAYAVFQADEEDTVVTLYESGKVVFQGVSADIDAAIWKHREKFLNPGIVVEEKNSDNKDKKDKKEIVIDPKIYYASTIGSDEVGTGDYFGPIVVTAAYVNKSDIPFLESLGVKDSKKMTDDKILEVVPKLIQKIAYESIVLSNKEYNQSYSKEINMNKIKAIMHNKVLLKMRDKQKEYDYIVVDQFAKPFVYYHYLKEVPNVCRNITFMTKGEDKCLSVACASLISRYIFVKEFHKIETKLGVKIPKGASTKVDETGVQVVRKYGKDMLTEVAKLNFKNTDKIKERLETL